MICEYLDSLHDGPKMFPAGPARWTALRRQAESDGILDAALLVRYETFLRPEERRWPEWIEGQKLKFRRALDALEAEADAFGDTVDIGTITTGCALGYLDFRYADEGWRTAGRSSRPGSSSSRSGLRWRGPPRSRSGDAETPGELNNALTEDGADSFGAVAAAAQSLGGAAAWDSPGGEIPG